MAFYRIEPWGYDVENLRAGKIAAMVGNASPRFKPNFKASDFFAWSGSAGTAAGGGDDVEQTPEEMKAILQAFNDVQYRNAHG